MSSIVQYTTWRSSCSVTALAGPSGMAARSKIQNEVRRAGGGRAHDRLQVSLSRLDRNGVKQRAVDDGAEAPVDDGAEAPVVACEGADVSDVEGGVGQPTPGRSARARSMAVCDRSSPTVV
jgi:hypothetical protein